MTPAFGSLRVFDDADALARGAAEWLTDAATATPGRFVLALSGGSTPKRLYTVLAEPPFVERFPWDRSQFVFGDERFVPPDDPASNARMATEAMFARAPVPPDHVHRVPTEGIGPDEAALRYEELLKQLNGGDTLDPSRPLFDVNLLGLGDDGHTASLIPGEPILTEQSRWTGVVAHGRPETRISLTYPVLNSSRHVVFLVQGDGKRAILERLLSGDGDVPASRIRPVGDVLWFVDRAAAGRWAS